MSLIKQGSNRGGDGGLLRSSSFGRPRVILRLRHVRRGFAKDKNIAVPVRKLAEGGNSVKTYLTDFWDFCDTNTGLQKLIG